MDSADFDALVRSWNRMSRRAGLRWLTGGGLTAALARFGWADSQAKKKKRKKKKKKKGAQPVSPPAPPVSPPQSPPSSPPVSPCVKNCTGKVCGNDGCGGSCGSCGNGETCSGGQCVPDTCTPACTGNHLCQNGSCVCPPGLKECEGPGYFGNCHECCIDAVFGLPDQECNASPNGEYCVDNDGELVFRCGCLSGLVACPDGRCGQCCNDGFCQVTQGPGRICNANHFCDCPTGTTYCSMDLGCRDTTSDKFACGQNCTNCGAGWECHNSNCCIGLANDCALNQNLCCAGLQCVNIGTVFEPNYVCGDPLS